MIVPLLPFCLRSLSTIATQFSFLLFFPGSSFLPVEAFLSAILMWLSLTSVPSVWRCPAGSPCCRHRGVCWQGTTCNCRPPSYQRSESAGVCVCACVCMCVCVCVCVCACACACMCMCFCVTACVCTHLTQHTVKDNHSSTC